VPLVPVHRSVLAGISGQALLSILGLHRTALSIAAPVKWLRPIPPLLNPWGTPALSCGHGVIPNKKIAKMGFFGRLYILHSQTYFS
jgi:hypothetical protein